MNGGTCIDTAIGFMCICVPGYTGTMCETGVCFSYRCLCRCMRAVTCIENNVVYICMSNSVNKIVFSKEGSLFDKCVMHLRVIQISIQSRILF